MYSGVVALVLAFSTLASARYRTHHANALLGKDTFANGTVVPPSEDPFYTPPTGYATTSSPGDILRSRQILPPVGGAEYTYQLLVRSTDSLNRSTAIVTTVLAPAFGITTKLLSVQTPYDSAFVDCGPSYTQQTGGNATADTFVQDALQHGFIVNVPDYEGPQAAFTNGPQSGQATLDSIRAVLQSKNITGVDSNAIVALAGYSGGALASEWAIELAPKYAPTMQIAGAALGGLTPNVTSVLFTINKTPFAGLGPSGLLGLTAQDADFTQYLQDNLVPANATKFNKARSQCLVDDIVTFANDDISSFFTNGLNTLLLPNVTQFTNTYGMMGMRDTPIVPIYAYKGVKDQISVVGDTDALVTKYCAKGAKIQYVRNSTTDHLSEETAGQPAAFQWLVDRFNLVPPMSGCNVTTI